MHWIFKIAIIALCLFWLPHFCHDKTDGFTILRIQSELPKSEGISTEAPPDVFSQEFTYLGSGGQAYAFVSKDNQYVLKFFKHHHHTLPFWRSLLPKASIREKKREKKRLRDFTSYRLCMEQLPEESGLLYVHLEKTDHLKTEVRIIDKIQIAHKIDLDSTAFILQKRATLAYEHLDALIERGDLLKAQEALISICDLVISRCQKGIYDEDPKIHRNFGFVDGKAILIDVGRLKRDPCRIDPRIQHSDLIQITSRLKTHLETRCPQLATFLEDYVESQ